MSKKESYETAKQDWSKMTSTEKWTKLKLNAKYRKGTKCMLPEIQGLQSVA